MFRPLNQSLETIDYYGSGIDTLVHQDQVHRSLLAPSYYIWLTFAQLPWRRTR